MANEVRYENQVWGEPIAGERLSTNGHYTGECVGSVLQDAKCEMTPHLIEEGIVRLGTMTPDRLNDIKQVGSEVVVATVLLNSEYAELTIENGNIWYMSPNVFPELIDIVRVGDLLQFSNDPTQNKYKVVGVEPPTEVPGANIYFSGNDDYSFSSYDGHEINLTIYRKQ